MGTLTAFIAAGPPPVGATRIPIFPPSLDTANLVGWWAPDDALVDGANRVTSLAPRVGSLKMVVSSSADAPLVEDAANGRNLFHTTIARKDKLLLEPAPGGSSWGNTGAPGMSFLMPMKILDPTTTQKGIANLFGLQVKHYTTAGAVQKLQVQRTHSAGTETFEANYDATPLTVLGVTLDVNPVNGVNTPILKLYRNGVMIGTKTTANWTGLATSVGVVGALTNLGGTPSEGQFGDVLMYSVAKSEAQMASISSALASLYGI